MNAPIDKNKTRFAAAAVLCAAVFIHAGMAFATAPQRIVSMSPAVTEILFAIGAGPRVVGVTDFCKYPPAVRAVAKVGGLLNPDVETLVALKPDLIIHHQDSLKIREHANNLGIRTLPVNLVDLENILRSILIVGDALEIREAAQRLHDKLQQGVEGYKNKLKDQRRKSVLIILGDSEDPLRDLYAAGKGTFLDELLTLAGGENILDRSLAIYPKVSKEYIISRSPEVIVEAIPRANFPARERSVHKTEWQRFSTIRAVKNDNIHFVAADYILIPGPRLLDIVDAFAKAIHPELFAGENPPGNGAEPIRP